jgi:hypothetical protein
MAQNYVDLHHNVQLARAISAVAVGTTGTGKTSSIIDRQAFGGVEFIINYGTVTATNATITPTMLECATTGGTFTSVADSDMLPQSGGELAASLVAAATRTSGTSKNFSTKLGYIGKLRYLELKLVPTVTATTPISVDALLHNPRHAPTK